MPVNATDQGIQTVRVPFIGNNTQGVDATKGQEFLNGFFEATLNPITGEKEFFFIKRPGLSTLLDPHYSGPGRGLFFWSRTGKLYSVNGNRLFSNTTDLNVTMRTSSGFCGIVETRPGATTQYLGINDGLALYLIGADDTVIVMNNVAIISSSVANPTTITTVSKHSLQTGNKIIIRNHTGSTPNLNDQIFTITKVTDTTFTIPVNVTVGGTGGTIGVFPSNTGDLQFLDGYWFVIDPSSAIWNCSVDDPTTWPVTSFINAQMLPGIGIGLGRQNNVLIAFSDRDVQMFYDAANPVGSPLTNIEQAMQGVGCIANSSIAYLENVTYWVSNTNNGGFSVFKLDGTSNIRDIGTPQVNRSIFKNQFSIAGPGTPTTVILTSGTSWTVPDNFNINSNTIEAIGGGGGGASPGGFGGGGGGGAYAQITNFAPAGSTVTYSIGAGNVNGGNGGDTSFNTSSLIAKGGSGASGYTGGAGGSSGGSTGSIKFSGGNGGNGDSGGSGAGGGGGGAAGSHGVGNNGTNFSGTNGGDGGSGDSGVGGAGGVHGTAPTNGSNGSEWITAGSGGGGGGANKGGIAGTGLGDGGLYGGGAGGSSATSGKAGVLVITYTPATQTPNTTVSGYILRKDGHIYYVLSLLTQKETWVYDQDLDLWTKWSDSTGVDVWPVFRTSQYATAGNPQSVVGQDLVTGKIWTISDTVYQDDGINFPVQVTTIPVDFSTKHRKFWHRVEPITDVMSAQTFLNISYSDNDYVSFTTPRALDISQVRPFTMALGNSRRRVWRVNHTDNTGLRIHGLEFGVEMELV